MPDIFLSYNREDQAVAHCFAKAFAREGFEVWWDVTLRSGDAYDEITETALREAKAVVVLWSPRSVVSRWVRSEATIADRNKTFLPATIEPCERPVMFELTQTADLSQWHGDEEDVVWQAFLDDVRRMVGTAGGSGASPSEAPRLAASSLPSRARHASIAVLPFANVSGDPEQEYFVQGMMDEIVLALTRIRTLRVISSESSQTLRDHDWDDQQAAERLGVRYLLQGSVRWAGNQVRIAVKLIDSSQGAQIWADKFDDRLEHVFDLQDRIALKVASVIEPSVHEAEVRRVARQPLESLGCYDLYLRAAPLRAACKRDEVLHALELLDRALALDPDFAPALVQAAGCHSQIYSYAWDEAGPVHRDQCVKLAERAVRLAAEDAAVLAQAANALMEMDGDHTRAKALADRATELNPSCARAWFISGMCRLVKGDAADGIERFRRAAELDPISPLNDMALVHIGMCQYMLSQFGEALSTMRATTHRTPRIRLGLAALYGQLNMLEEAREEMALYRRDLNLPHSQVVDQIPNIELRELLYEGLRRSVVGGAAAS